jgi:hypothetical protein
MRVEPLAEAVNRHQRGLAIAEGLTAIAALAGSIGLATGAIDLGATINSRLPLRSPVLGAVALTLVVAAPMAAATVVSWRGGERVNFAAVGAGVALMTWIIVEIAFIRSISWLQPTFFILGAAIAFAGYRRWPET